MSKSVGVRDLKNQASAILRRTRSGDTIVVTDRGKPVALLVAVAGKKERLHDRIRALVAAGRLSWSGGKPRGLRNAPRVRGPSVSAAVIEDRR